MTEPKTKEKSEKPEAGLLRAADIAWALSPAIAILAYIVAACVFM